MMKPNCYECKFREDLPGDCHSRCVHPSIFGTGILALLGRDEDAIKVEGNEHGISHGWFYWPLNFDPVWMKSCTGFEEISKPEVIENK